MADERPLSDDWLGRYLLDRDQEREQEGQALLEALSEREARLVREAAVSGFVRGVMHAGKLHEVQIPPDRHIVSAALDTVRSFPDLYPTLANYQPEDDGQLEGDDG